MATLPAGVNNLVLEKSDLKNDGQKFSRKVILSPDSKPTIEWIPLHMAQYAHAEESGMLFIGGRDCALHKIKKEKYSKCATM